MKKKVKISEAYYAKFLESMDDQNIPWTVQELTASSSGNFQPIYTSEFVRSKMIKENIRKVYKIGKWLGTGQFGSVRIATRLTEPDKKYAIKSIKRWSSEDYIRQLEKEFWILKDVDHPNIIKFYECYQDQKYFHFVIEYWEGGELFNMITKKGSITEQYAARIIRKTTSAIAHLHDKNICHRDLKPENIMFKDTSPDSEIKLIDFGLSTYTIEDRVMKTKVGTPYYVAPEVLEGEYQKSWDMWSIGVITYLMLWGHPPFQGETNDDIFDAIESAKITFPPKEWKNISKEAKLFIKKLLVRNPKMRMTPVEALNHPWLKSTFKNTVLDLDVINRLKQFQAPRKLQTEFLLLLSDFINGEDYTKIRRTFEAIDVDHSGWISLEELYNALIDYEDASTIQEIMDNIDFDKNGEINYSEFLAATIDRKYFESKETVQKIFNHFDTENKGVITSDGLRKAFQRGSKSYTEDEVDEMIFEFTGKHEINYEEFKKLLSNPI